MRFRISRCLVSLFVVALLIGWSSCTDKEEKSSFAQYENIRKIELSLADLRHIREIARACLTDKAYDRQVETYRQIYSPGTRGVFLTLVRPRERALTAMAFGSSMEEAIKSAAVLMKRIAVNDDPQKLPLRIDIIDSTSDRRTKVMKTKWRLDLPYEGLIFNTDPIVAVLPQEIIGYEIISDKGKYSAAAMKRYVGERVLGNILRENFQEDSENDYITFKTQSFMEKEDGDIVLLYGIGPIDVRPESDNLLRAALDGGEYLRTNIDLTSGRMNYRYYPQRDLDSKSYNNLRHAGTVYAMTEVYEVTRDKEMLDAVQAGIRWILSNIEGPNAEDAAKGADFKVYVDGKEKSVKTGGAGLALAALAKYTAVTGDRRHLELMRALARFIRFNIKENGNLASHYFLQEEQSEEKESNFYPGECVFGLMKLYAVDPNPDWISGARKIADYLRTERDKGATPTTIFQDTWLALALPDLYAADKSSADVAYAFLIGDAIVKTQLTDGPRIDAVGGFGLEPASTPTASRVEALNALIPLAEKENDQARLNAYRKAAAMAAQYQLRTQYGKYNSVFFPSPHDTLGGFMESFRRPEIEIDYIQHNISALLGTWRTLMRMSGKDPESVYGKTEAFLSKKEHHIRTSKQQSDAVSESVE